MDLIRKLTGWFKRDDSGSGDLKRNMEKALHMKQQAGPQAKIPPHQTARDGAIHGEQRDATDRDAASEGTFTPKFKRSHVARSGDAS